MKTFGVLFALLITLPAFAGDEERDIGRVRSALKFRVGIRNFVSDARLLVDKTSEAICGRTDESYIAEFQVRKARREYDKKAQSYVFIDQWETVKTYTVPVADVATLSDAKLMSEIRDADRCQD